MKKRIINCSFLHPLRVYVCVLQRPTKRICYEIISLINRLCISSTPKRFLSPPAWENKSERTLPRKTRSILQQKQQTYRHSDIQNSWGRNYKTTKQRNEKITSGKAESSSKSSNSFLCYFVNPAPVYTYFSIYSKR